MTITFDPATYKRTTRQQWQDAAQAWHRWGPTLEDWLGDATTRMPDAAAVGPGSRVLDVAAGAGGQSLAAARRVGPDGRVLATDIAPAILEYAANAATEAGLSNVETLEADGERLDVPEAAFDAAISRVGLIYFPDQQAALGGIRRALRPGGRLQPSSTPLPTATLSSLFPSASSGAAPNCHRRPPDSRGPSASADPVSPRRRWPAPASTTSLWRPYPRRCTYPALPIVYGSSASRLARYTRCSPDCRRRTARRRGPR